MPIIVVFLGAVARTSAQAPVVTGRVTERGTGEPINGADVELSGVGRVATNPRGDFVFPNAKNGRRMLTVKMIGYRTHEARVDISGNLNLVIELDVEAVRVEGVTARNRTYTLRGSVIDVRDGTRIIDAEVLLGSDKRAGTNWNGRFKISRARAGEPTEFQVRAMGFLPHDAVILSDKDTAVHIVLKPDPVGQRMIDRQVERLEVRTRAVGYAVQHMDRAELLRNNTFTLYDLLRTRLGVTSMTRNRAAPNLGDPAGAARPGSGRSGGELAPDIACLFIDDRQELFGLEVLKSMLPEQIERVEIIDRGTMVRIYTRRHIQDMLRNRVQVTPILLIETPRGMTCK